MVRPSTRALRRLAPLWLITPVVLLLYWWTWTESAAVTLKVADGRCTAVLYDRSSTINCPGLPGGRLSALLDTGLVADGRPVARLRPPGAWSDLGLSVAGQPAIAAAPLPASFEVSATLRRPAQPAGLLLLRPDGRAGWVFIVDAANRRGAWWAWAGAPATPLRGIPLDRPFAEQAKPLLRQLLAGWPAAAGLVALAGLLSRWTKDRRRPAAGHAIQPTNKPIPASRPSSPATTRLLPGPWPLVPLLLFAFAVALHVAVDVLERIPHIQDSVTYLFQAQTLAGGALVAPAPPLAAADATPHFEQEFLLVRDGRWFGKYPPGWPALLALGVRLGAPWLVNPLLAALSVALFYQLGRCFKAQGSRGAGGQGRGERSPLATRHSPPVTDLLRTDLLNTAYRLLPTFLLTTSPFLLIMSGSLMAHPAELLWAVLFMLAWGRALVGGLATRPTRRWAAVAGLALGALFLTRQFTALTIGLAFGGGLLLMALKQQAASPRHSPLATRHSPPATLLFAALAAAPFVLALPFYQQAVTGDARADPRLLYWPYDRVGFGPGSGEPENAFTMTPSDAGPAITWYTDPQQPPRGHSPARGLYNLGRNLDALMTDLFGWPPALTLAFVWLAFLLRRPAAVDWLLLLTLAAVAGGYVAYWAAGIAYGPRYFYAALPALVILTARGATALAKAAGGWRVVGLILLLLVGYNLISLPGRLDAYRGYNFVSGEERQLVEASVEAPALVFVATGDADWWEYGAFFSGNTPWLDGPVVYARDLGADENARLRAAFPDRRAYQWTDHRPRGPEQE